MRLFFALFLLIPAFCLAACGFEPIYGAHEGAPLVVEQLNAVAIDNIADHEGQMLRNDLIDRMYAKGRPAQPLYRLSVGLSIQEEDLGQLANATAVFAEIHTYGTYALAGADGKEILHGVAHSATGYDRLDNQFATLSARQDAMQRTIHEISEQIVNRLSLHFAELPAATPAK